MFRDELLALEELSISFFRHEFLNLKAKKFPWTCHENGYPPKVPSQLTFLLGKSESCLDPSQRIFGAGKKNRRRRREQSCMGRVTSNFSSFSNFPNRPSKLPLKPEMREIAMRRRRFKFESSSSKMRLSKFWIKYDTFWAKTLYCVDNMWSLKMLHLPRKESFKMQSIKRLLCSKS